MKPKKIIIIHSGSNDKIDDADTLRQVEEISNLVKVTTVLSVRDLDLLKKLAGYNKNEVIIFNLVETFANSDSEVYRFSAILDFLQLKYTGASTEFLFATKDKITTKKILQSSKIKTARWLEENQLNNSKQKTKYIVKSTSEHCSLGIDDNSVSDCNLADIVAKKKKEFGGIWFAEEYVEGKEFNVSVLKVNNKLQVLPIPEMVFADGFSHKHKIVHYEAKWDETSNIYDKLQRKFYDPKHKLSKKLSRIALQVAKEFNINSYARIDFRVNEKDEAFVIDINANPCLSSDAGFMAAAKKFNLTPKQVIQNIIQNSYE